MRGFENTSPVTFHSADRTIDESRTHGGPTQHQIANAATTYIMRKSNRFLYCKLFSHSSLIYPLNLILELGHGNAPTQLEAFINDLQYGIASGMTRTHL